MSQQLQALELRDFHGGRNANANISNALAPIYTVSDGINVNFDTIIGSAVVRSGTTKITTANSLGTVPLGLANFATQKGTIYNRIILANNGKVYYYNGNWHLSNLTNLSTSNRVRFTMLGNQMFLVNGATFKSSSDGGATWGSTNCTSITPGVIVRAKGRILVAGDTSQSPSRVFFSTVIDPTTSPGSITWVTNSTTGNYIDVNPDDGDSITGFAQTSTYTLVFKNNAMYRLDVINKSVDTDNIFNIGAPSQEAIITVQGVTYFFSGKDIRRTTGDFPEQISRLGVQDYIDALTYAQWTSVYTATDGINPYFFLGNVTLNSNRDNQKTVNNVCLKFSTRDQSWSVHSYGTTFKAFTNISTTTLAGLALVGADTSGLVQQLNSGTSDNTAAIFYELTTQSLDFGLRAHQKTITNGIAVYTQYGNDSQIQLLPDDGDPVAVNDAQNLNARVTNLENTNVSFNFLKVRWFGSTTTNQPVFEGVYFENVTDDGLIND